MQLQSTQTNMQKIVISISLLLLVVSLASAQKMADKVVTGSIAPDFTLTSGNGGAVTLSKVDAPVLLVFYRGYWCPYCVKQLSELRSLLTTNDKAQLLAISIDPPEKSRELATKIAKDGKGEVKFTFLSDPGHKTIASYGLIDPAYVDKGIYGIPHPTVYVLDKNRKVLWSRIESDYKNRPTNQEIRAELDKLK